MWLNGEVKGKFAASITCSMVDSGGEGGITNTREPAGGQVSGFVGDITRIAITMMPHTHTHNMSSIETRTTQ